MNRLMGTVVWMLTAQIACADCPPQWADGFHEPGASFTVNATLVHDDGSGPALFIAGSFDSVDGVAASRIAKWDGSRWSPLGSGTDGTIFAMAEFDDGSSTGPVLYVTGSFTSAGGVEAMRIARWNGVSWSPVSIGINNTGLVLTVYNDGQGDALYVGGAFTSVGGNVPANRIAKWNGQQWSSLGTGVNDMVRAIEVFDSDGPGPNQPELYVGGLFTTAGGASASRVAKWNGTTWSALGSGLSGTASATVWDFEVHDSDVQGPGPSELYIGGFFSNAGGIPVGNIAKWNGSTWAGVVGGTNGEIQSIRRYADEGGTGIYVGGGFSTAGGFPANNLAKWNGTSWSPLGTGVNNAIKTLIIHNEALYAGGQFTVAGGLNIYHIARWSNDEWSSVSDGQGANADVVTLTVYDDQSGSGAAIFAGGDFTAVGTLSATRVAKWDGAAWTPLGSGVTGLIQAAIVHNDGSGDALYVGGFVTQAGGVNTPGFARWNGTQWQSVGGGVAGLVRAFAVYDDGTGPALYVAGSFGTAGGIPANSIAKWNGSSWSTLGSGLQNGFVTSLLPVANDPFGGGPALYVGGSFSSVGGVTSPMIAKWKNGQWIAMNSGMNQMVVGMALFDDDGTGPNGPSLFAGGHFTMAGGVPANRIAKWDGTSWSALGTGLTGGCNVLRVFNDGTGPVLFVGGFFTHAGGVPSTLIAKWFNGSWSSVGTGLIGDPGTTSYVAALTPHTSDEGLGLYIGGVFRWAGGVRSINLARWSCSDTCPQDIAPFNGDGAVTVVDLLAVINAWGPCQIAGDCPPDIDGDGSVGVIDLLSVINAWGSCP